jgi:predicted nucleotidyltransferase
VDLVIELPAVFAMSSAEYFAFGGVRLLDSLNMIDCISFGSETGEINSMEAVSGILANEPDTYKEILKDCISSGHSYPSAREKALNRYFKSVEGLQTPANIISTANNILGIEYLKALKKLESKIKPYTIKRQSNQYNTSQLTGEISSSTAIREYLLEKHDIYKNEFKNSLPPITFETLVNEYESGRAPVSPSNYDLIMLSNLRRMQLCDIAKLPYVSEGLENKIKAAADECGSIAELISNIKSRRYTATRIPRILFHSLTGLTSMELDDFMKHGGPQYIRVLGFNDKGRELLHDISRKCSLPLITKTADLKRSDNRLAVRMLEIEAAATDMYVLGYTNPEWRRAGQEFTQNVVRV